MEECVDLSNNYFKKVRGSDPRLATCRGKLQNQRAKLNQEINKQIMIRNGAEKLYKVTTNKKLREMVALELSFINSNLQLLKEQLADLNSSVNIYQDRSSTELIPMIPLGLKETKEIDFRDPFKDFILEHYSEDASKYEMAIKEFMERRQAVRTPTRDEYGVKLLFGYYNLLKLIDKRFFPPHRNIGIFFEWFDSLTGVPSTQRTIAFEKASVLFNIAALYSQIATKQNRSKTSGVDSAVNYFLRAAGMFQYIRENFSNAPSMDLSEKTLDALTQLMLAQARECLFDKPGVETQSLEACLELAQEASQVSLVYSTVHKIMNNTSIKAYVPYSWIGLTLVKSEHYRALSHHHLALALLENNGNIETFFDYIYSNDAKDCSLYIDVKVPKTIEEKHQLGIIHLKQSLLHHEEALRLHRMCRQLKNIDNLQERLKTAHAASMDRYRLCEQEDAFEEILDAPPIQAATKYQLTLMQPDFAEYQVEDLFQDLGPLKAFSARHQWTAARLIEMQKSRETNFGFSVGGDTPVVIAAVDPGSLAEKSGLKVGDFIVRIGKTDSKWMKHEDVVSLIRESGNQLTLKVVTPITIPSNASTLSVGVRMRNSPFAKDQRRRATWNFFRRSKEFPTDTLFR